MPRDPPQPSALAVQFAPPEPQRCWADVFLSLRSASLVSLGKETWVRGGDSTLGRVEATPRRQKAWSRAVAWDPHAGQHLLMPATTVGPCGGWCHLPALEPPAWRPRSTAEHISAVIACVSAQAVFLESRSSAFGAVFFVFICVPVSFALWYILVLVSIAAVTHHHTLSMRNNTALFCSSAISCAAGLGRFVALGLTSPGQDDAGLSPAPGLWGRATPRRWLHPVSHVVGLRSPLLAGCRLRLV